MGLHVIVEAKRCLNCKKPRCQEGCPIHTPIPVMIQMLLQGEMPEAAEMVFANNPLSVICSLVCDHEKQCEGHCVKGIKGEPVHISSIENYISDTCFDRMKLEQLPKNGKRIAVVGAGPAGITIAILMACRGYKVTIFNIKNPVILYWTVKLSYAFGYYSETSPIFKSMSQRNLCLIRQYLSKKMQRNSIVF